MGLTAYVGGKRRYSCTFTAGVTGAGTTVGYQWSGGSEQPIGSLANQPVPGTSLRRAIRLTSSDQIQVALDGDVSSALAGYGVFINGVYWPPYDESSRWAYSAGTGLTLYSGQGASNTIVNGATYTLEFRPNP